MHPIMFDEGVTRATRGYLCKNGVPKCELDDALAEVQTRALEALEDRSPPKDVEGWQKLLITIARNYLVNRTKAEKVAAKHGTATCAEPDAFPALVPSGERRDPVDQKRQLEVLMGMFENGEMPELGREILAAVADGVKVPAIGRELGIPAKEVRGRLRTMRRKYFRRLAGMGMLALVLALFAVAGGPGAVALWKGAPGEPGPGPGATRAPEEVAAQVVGPMRWGAMKACDAGKWEQCVAGLDAAKVVDPAGEQAPEVKAARARVTEAERVREMEEQWGREVEAKPR